jgi:hypothetical protein
MAWANSLALILSRPIDASMQVWSGAPLVWQYGARCWYRIDELAEL